MIRTLVSYIVAIIVGVYAANFLFGNAIGMQVWTLAMSVIFFFLLIICIHSLITIRGPLQTANDNTRRRIAVFFLLTVGFIILLSYFTYAEINPFGFLQIVLTICVVGAYHQFRTTRDQLLLTVPLKKRT